MAADDLVGMENIASPHKELEISDLPAGRGSMPGKPHEEAEAEKHEMELKSGHGLIP